MRPVRRRDRQNRRLLQGLLRRRGIVNPQEDYMVDDLGRPIVNLLPEAEVAGTPTQYKEADLAKAGLLAAREVGGMVPGLDYALDAAEIENIRRTGKDFYGDETTPESYAAMVGAGMLLPGVVRRAGRGVGKAAKKLFKFGNKSKDEFDIFASGLKETTPEQDAKRLNLRLAQIRRNQAIEDLKNMRPSKRLKATAEDRAKKANRLANPIPLDVDESILRGNVKNPYDRETHQKAMQNLADAWYKEFTPGNVNKYGNTVPSAFLQYSNWLSLRKPELMKRVAGGDFDAILEVYNDKNLADEFFAETQRTYRGVEVPKDSPIVEDALLNPDQYGDRAYGEGVYTTGAPGKARTYTGQRKGSVGVLESDIEYDNPIDLLRHLEETTEIGRGVSNRGRGEYMKGHMLHGVGGGDDVRVYNQYEKLGKGKQRAKLKLLDILSYDEAGEVIKDLNRVGIDKQFWGDARFDPSRLNDRYLRAMRGGEGFVTAQNELKALNADQAKNLASIAKRYEVGAAVAKAAEIGIVVSPITIAIMSAIDTEGTDSKYASNSTAKKGVTAVRKKRDGMSPIRK